MSVYVDGPREYSREPDGYVGHQRQRALWCHMIADSLDELHRMADLLGLRRSWFQGDASTPHYDMTPSKRALAVKFGAVELDRRGFVTVIRRLRKENVAR